jgi:hypothetical protein
MNTVNFANTQSFPANTLTLPELLHIAKLANPHLIDYCECTEYQNGSQYSFRFQLAHLFREFRVPQISGEFDVNSKRNDDGGIEYSTLSAIDRGICKLESLVVKVSNQNTEISVTCVTQVDKEIPRLVITAAKRMLRLAMKATAEYISTISASTEKTI